MSTHPLGLRVICDSKRSASCRYCIETDSFLPDDARTIARDEGWDTTPGTPIRDICPACIEHAQRGLA